MKTYSVALAAAALLISGSIASAQQQFDSLGSRTPAPNQKVSPNVTAPNIPVPGTTAPGQNDKSGAPTGAQSATPARPPGAILPDANQPSTTGRALGPLVNPNAPYADD
jgi:hypothetical protein